MSKELNLPNPGQGRYFDIAVVPRTGNYTVTLRSTWGASIVEAKVWQEDASTTVFEGVAQMLIKTAANEVSFVGQYKFEETN